MAPRFCPMRALFSSKVFATGEQPTQTNAEQMLPRGAAGVANNISKNGCQSVAPPTVPWRRIRKHARTKSHGGIFGTISGRWRQTSSNCVQSSTNVGPNQANIGHNLTTLARGCTRVGRTLGQLRRFLPPAPGNCHNNNNKKHECVCVCVCLFRAFVRAARRAPPRGVNLLSMPPTAHAGSSCIPNTSSLAEQVGRISLGLRGEPGKNATHCRCRQF